MRFRVWRLALQRFPEVELVGLWGTQCLGSLTKVVRFLVVEVVALTVIERLFVAVPVERRRQQRFLVVRKYYLGCESVIVRWELERFLVVEGR